MVTGKLIGVPGIRGSILVDPGQRQKGGYYV